ncbi:hypothetical protein ACTMTJ_33240 [Phytohabitans sp. LJ34]|uniref:hypothetical protein n=1 Tax=Phytohabitans sp. LJ34 TaxID=3452217 RepID=UPI003F889832
MRWLRFPIGRDAAFWRTVATERTVLAAVHTMASAGHVLDAIELLEPDRRIQVVFTQAPDRFSGGVHDHLRAAGVVAIDWDQAVHTDFDLVVSADRGGLHELGGPWLALAHGVMNNKLTRASGGMVVGLGAPWFTHFGRLLPAAVAVSHPDVVDALRHQCPEAVPVAAVTGDLCLDRLVESRRHRAAYREALGVDDQRTLVAISSTWGPDSLLGRAPDTLFDLVADLPDRYAVTMVIHPGAWHGHGSRQVLAWLARQRRAGLRLVDPASWRGLVAAADVVIGDHGSATIYAAAAGVPVLRAGPLPPTAPGAAAEIMGAVTRAVEPGRPLGPQLRAAVASFDAAAYARVAGAVTARPGAAASLLRARMYHLLRLPEPETGCAPAPVGRPMPVGDDRSRL